MPVTIVVAALAAGSIVLIALGIALSGTGGVTLERLERYAAGAKPDAVAGGGQGGVGELIAKSAALAQLNRVVEKRDFGANLLRDLGAADLKLKPSEYLAIWGGLTVGVPVVLFLLGFLVPSLQNPLMLMLGLVVGFMAPRLWLGRRKSGRLKAFNKQLPDTVTLIANVIPFESAYGGPN